MKLNFKAALKIIAERMKGLNWAIIGSTNMALQGMNVMPKDIDIVVSMEDFDKLPEIFKDILKSDKKRINFLNNEPAWEIKIDINNVEVQLLAEAKNGVYASKLLLKEITKIKLNDIVLPCLTLKAEARAYKETDRKSKAELIENYVNYRGLKPLSV